MPPSSKDSILGMDAETFIFVTVTLGLFVLIIVIACAAYCRRALLDKYKDNMDTSAKQVNLKKRLLNQLKKEAKELTRTQKRSNLFRSLSRSDNKENSLTDVENCASAGECGADCAICLEKFRGDATKINIGLLSPCGHYYHFECLWDWLRMRLSCPICRHQVHWSERQIRAATYARFLEESTLKSGISFVPRKEEDDSLSVTSVESLEYSGCFPRFTNRVMPAVHQTRIGQHEPRVHRILSVQETLSNVALAQVYFI